MNKDLYPYIIKLGEQPKVLLVPHRAGSSAFEENLNRGMFRKNIYGLRLPSDYIEDNVNWILTEDCIQLYTYLGKFNNTDFKENEIYIPIRSGESHIRSVLELVGYQFGDHIKSLLLDNIDKEFTDLLFTPSGNPDLDNAKNYMYQLIFSLGKVIGSSTVLPDELYNYHHSFPPFIRAALMICCGYNVIPLNLETDEYTNFVHKHITLPGVNISSGATSGYVPSERSPLYGKVLELAKTYNPAISDYLDHVDYLYSLFIPIMENPNRVDKREIAEKIILSVIEQMLANQYYMTFRYVLFEAIDQGIADVDLTKCSDPNDLVNAASTLWANSKYPVRSRVAKKISKVHWYKIYV